MSKFVYGPVLSRRLGLSLGVDLLPEKACCYDCVYCQVGRTTKHTAERACFVDPDEVIREVEGALAEGPRPQVITLAGSGEPTLYLALGELEQGLRRVTDLPLAILTGSGLLGQEPVVRTLLNFDLVAPSLDAGDAETFTRVNQPVEALSFDLMVQGLQEFTHRYRGECPLEVMLIKGINDHAASLTLLAQMVRSLRISRVELNTAVRPSACGVRRLSHHELEQARGYFSGEVQIIVPQPPAGPDAANGAVGTHQIQELVARRPSSVADLSRALGVPLTKMEVLCEAAYEEGLLGKTTQQGVVFYLAVQRGSCGDQGDQS